MYVAVVTLPTEDDKRLSEKLKSGFKRTIKWNKYRSEMTKLDKSNNLNYLIDPTFNKVNRLFVLSFENEDDRTFFSKYYTPTVEIKDFNVLIDGKKSFYYVPVKNKKETCSCFTEIWVNTWWFENTTLFQQYHNKQIL